MSPDGTWQSQQQASKADIAVYNRRSLHCYEKSHAIWDHTVLYLTHSSSDFPAFIANEADTQFRDPSGMQG